jgi:hypothetical protein
MTETLPPGVIHLSSIAVPPTPPPDAARSAPYHSQVRIVTPPPQHHHTAMASPRFAEHRETRSPALSQSEAREKLSDWVVYRFEKVKHAADAIDENGYPVKPTWDHVHRYQISNLSRREISKAVRELDKKTLPAPAKKATLSEPIQHQLNKALDYLTQSEYDPRYHYVLAQIDSELRQRDPSEDSEDRHSSRRSRSSSSRHKSKSRKSKSKTRKTFERVSVTAYFKRTPRREEDAVALYQMYQRRSSPAIELQTTTRSRRASISDPTTLQRSSHLYPSLSPADQQQPHHSHNHNHHHQRRHSQMLPVPLPDHQVQVISRDGKEIQVVRESPRTSHSSFTDDDEVTGASDNELTPQSSVDGSPARRHTRHARFRSRSPSRERPRPAPRSRSSSPVPDSPRQHGRHDDNYAWTSTPSRLPHAPSPPHANKPRTAPVEIDRTEDLDRYYRPSRVDSRRVPESWERGRRHEDEWRERRRPEGEIEVLEQQSSRSKQHSTPPLTQPSRVNRRRASVRIIAPEDIKHGSYDSDRDVELHFERLRIDEESHPHRGSNPRDHERRSRRSVDYTSRHPDEIFHMEDHMSWDEKAPREHRRRASSPDMDRNPFTGRPISHRVSEYR